MKREYILISLFFLITAVIFYFVYQLIAPFFAPIAWAAVFAIVFFPLYEKLNTRLKSKKLSSAIISTLIIVLIIAPLAYLLVAVIEQAVDAISKVNTMYQKGEFDELLSFNMSIIESIKEKLSSYYDLSKIETKVIIKNSIDKISSAIFNESTWIITNASKGIFYFFIMIFTMYYFFTDGELLINKIKRLMPLNEEQINLTFKRLRDIIQATMYGGVVVALIQGILGGLLFFLADIPSAIFWGAIMAFLSFIPFVGAFIIYFPAGVILMMGGHYISGIVVIAFGSIIISQVDNVLRPFLISGKTQMHPLILFFTIMGGIYLFGMLGIFLGPMIAAVFITLLKIFEFKLHPEDESISDTM